MTEPTLKNKGIGRPKELQDTEVRKPRTFTLSDDEVEMFKDIKRLMANEDYFDANNSAIVRAALKNLTWLPDANIVELVKKYS